MRIPALLTLPLAALLVAGCDVYGDGYDGGFDGGYGPPPGQDTGPLPPDFDDQAGFRAIGTEPFWSLTIVGDEMRYEPMEGPPLVVQTPRPARLFNGERYVTRRLAVTITNVECSDGMSDRTYSDTVTVQVDGRTLNGCGGRVLAGDEGRWPPPGDREDWRDDRPDDGFAGRLDGDWRVVSIDGRAASTSSISFDEGRLTGRSCNGFSGSYRDRGRGTIAVGPIAATRMACPGPRMDEEDALFSALEGELSVRELAGGRIELAGRDRRRIVLARR